MKLATYFVLAFALMLSHNTRGQSPEWKSYEPPNGEASWLSDLAVPPSGIIWIAEAHLGVSALVENQWKSYDQTSAPFSEGDVVTAVASNTPSSVWVATYNEPYSGGLLNYDGQLWSEYTTSDSDLPEDGITGLCLDHTNAVWVAGEDPEIGQGSFVARFDGDSWMHQFTDQTTGDEFGGLTTVDAIDCGNNETVWISVLSYNASADTTLPSIVRYADGDWTFTRPPFRYDAQFTVTAIAGSDENTVWVGTHDQGLHKYDGQTWSRFDTTNSDLPSDSINAITIGSDSAIWIGTPAGLSRLEGSHWSNYNASNSELPNDSVRKLAVDEFSNVWMITGDLESGSRLTVFQEGGLINVGTAHDVVDNLAPMSIDIFPNPFRTQTTIQFELPEPGSVRLEAYDLLGRRIWQRVDIIRTSGRHSVIFRASNLPAGVYTVRLFAGGSTVESQIVLVP